MDFEKSNNTMRTPEARWSDRQQKLGEALLLSIAIQGGIEYPNHDPKACLDYIQGALPEDLQQEVSAELTAMYPEDKYQPAQLFRFILQSEIMSTPHDEGSRPEPWVELANAGDKRKLQLTEAGNATMMDIYGRIRDGDIHARYMLDQVVQLTAPIDSNTKK